MKITNRKEQGIKNNPHGVDVRLMNQTKYAQCLHLTLQPGESLKPHITPVDAVFYVLEGNPTVTIGDEAEDVYEGCCIDSPADIIHFISNYSNNVARILVIKTPMPKKSTKIL